MQLRSSSSSSAARILQPNARRSHSRRSATQDARPSTSALAGDASVPDDDLDAGELSAAATSRLVGAIGLLARKGDELARTSLLQRVGDSEVRVRRAAILALGKLGGDDATAVLIARWDAHEVPPDERRALAEALGKLGGDEAMKRSAALDPGDDSELARRRDRATPHG